MQDFKPLTQEEIEYSQTNAGDCGFPVCDYSPTRMDVSPANYGTTLGLGKAEWTLPSPASLRRQDARVWSPVRSEDPPKSPRERAMARVGRDLPSLSSATEELKSEILTFPFSQTVPPRQEMKPTRVFPPVSPGGTDLQMRPPKIPDSPIKRKKKGSKRAVVGHLPGVEETTRTNKRVRLSSAHLREMRTRTMEVMDLLDPICPMCHLRLSDCRANSA